MQAPIPPTRRSFWRKSCAAGCLRHCDGAVMVIESGAISYRLEQKVKGQLEKSGCRILGAVLNKVDVHTKGYYGKYGRYGRYKRYDSYKEYGGEKKKS